MSTTANISVLLSLLVVVVSLLNFSCSFMLLFRMPSVAIVGVVLHATFILLKACINC